MPSYVAIDLKSFYASVECVERRLDPLTTNLVVADPERTEKTICLAVTPSLKSFNIPGRARLFEVVQRVKTINYERIKKAPFHRFSGKSYISTELDADPSLELDYIIAPPQMALYMKISLDIYKIYLKYIAPEDIHVYSVDEVFIDVTNYLRIYKCTPRQLTVNIINDILNTTGITATAGIGTNLYLAKIAMDIVAKHMPPDKNGVRIAELTEQSYREQLWEHRPLTDFWRIGKGISKKLESKNLYTMGDIANCSVNNEDLLYNLFGINAELIIDHAWGWESCTIKAIKSYKPSNHSISQGQVLKCPYTFEKARLIIREMTELIVLELVEKNMITDQMILTVGYDSTDIPEDFDGEMTTDHYGRKIPKQAHSSINIGHFTSSTKQIVSAVIRLFDRIVNNRLSVRRMYIVANHVINEKDIPDDDFEQLSMFIDNDAVMRKKEIEARTLEKERSIQSAMISIKKRFGKNAILKGMNLCEGATSIERNKQVGGHKA